MCGRYTLSVPLSNLIDTFEVPPPEFEYQPRFNIAPTQVVPVIAADERGRRMGLLRWGLIPSWAKDPGIGSRMINARSETVAEKPSFRSAFRKRRCLIPADGFFEWKKDGGEEGRGASKTPFWIHLSTREPFAFAGLWERWSPPDGEDLFTFTILTTEATPSIHDIHPRMPVILPAQARARWLDPEASPEALLGLLKPYSQGNLQSYAVASIVNSPRNDHSECIAQV
jgi:putative SOS response-associated peptidase YedK